MEFAFFQIVFTPLLLGSASLLVMLTTRNASLSDRVRSATRLINDDHPDMPALRRENLLDQISSFHQRYILNELALGALAFALLLFIVMSLFASHKNLTIATILFYCGLVSLAFGFILTGADVARGMHTLDLEVQYANRRYKPRTANRDALKQQIARWMQADPEYAQVVQDVVHSLPATLPLPPSNSDPALKKDQGRR